MGTVVSFDLRAETTTEAGQAAGGAGATAAAALEHAKAQLQWADDVFSTWKPESPMSRVRRGELALSDAPPEVAEVLELCRKAREASDGWFDPWAMPGGVDPTGLVKGWAAGRALDGFRRAGLPGAMVNAGGDIAVYGRPAPGQSWRLGVRDPLVADRIMLVVELEGAGALATSGAYERGDHILEPASGAAAHSLLAATVVGHELGYADALATALFASGGALLGRLGELAGYHGLVIDRQGALRASRGFPFTLQGIEAATG
jgi:thiamine biosynthesis lipoprotein